MAMHLELRAPVLSNSQSFFHSVGYRAQVTLTVANKFAVKIEHPSGNPCVLLILFRQNQPDEFSLLLQTVVNKFGAFRTFADKLRLVTYELHETMAPRRLEAPDLQNLITPNLDWISSQFVGELDSRSHGFTRRRRFLRQWEANPELQQLFHSRWISKEFSYQGLIKLYEKHLENDVAEVAVGCQNGLRPEHLIPEVLWRQLDACRAVVCLIGCSPFEDSSFSLKSAGDRYFAMIPETLARGSHRPRESDFLSALEMLRKLLGHNQRFKILSQKSSLVGRDPYLHVLVLCTSEFQFHAARSVLPELKCSSATEAVKILEKVATAYGWIPSNYRPSFTVLADSLRNVICWLSLKEAHLALGSSISEPDVIVEILRASREPFHSFPRLTADIDSLLAHEDVDISEASIQATARKHLAHPTVSTDDLAELLLTQRYLLQGSFRSIKCYFRMEDLAERVFERNTSTMVSAINWRSAPSRDGLFFLILLRLCDTWLETRGILPSESTGASSTWLSRPWDEAKTFCEIASYLRRCLFDDPENLLRETQRLQLLMVLDLVTMEDLTRKARYCCLGQPGFNRVESLIPCTKLSVPVDFLRFLVDDPANSRNYSPVLLRWRNEAFHPSRNSQASFQLGRLRALVQSFTNNLTWANEMIEFVRQNLKDEKLTQELQSKVDKLSLTRFPPTTGMGREVMDSVWRFSPESAVHAVLYRSQFVRIVGERKPINVEQVIHLVMETFAITENILRRAISGENVRAKDLYDTCDFEIDREIACLSQLVKADRTLIDSIPRLVKLARIDRAALEATVRHLKRFCENCFEDCSSFDFYSTILVRYTEVENVDTLPILGRPSLHEICSNMATALRTDSDDVQVWLRIRHLDNQRAGQLRALLDTLADIPTKQLERKLDWLRVSAIDKPERLFHVRTFSRLFRPIKALADDRRASSRKLRGSQLALIGNLLKDDAISDFSVGRFSLSGFATDLRSSAELSSQLSTSNLVALDNAKLGWRITWANNKRMDSRMLLSASNGQVFKLFGQAPAAQLVGHNQIQDFVTECLVASSVDADADMEAKVKQLSENVRQLRTAIESLENAHRLGVDIKDAPREVAFDALADGIRFTEGHRVTLKTKENALRLMLESLKRCRSIHPYLELIEDERLLCMSHENDPLVRRLISLMVAVVPGIQLPAVQEPSNLLLRKISEIWHSESLLRVPFTLTLVASHTPTMCVQGSENISAFFGGLPTHEASLALSTALSGLNLLCLDSTALTKPARVGLERRLRVVNEFMRTKAKERSLDVRIIADEVSFRLGTRDRLIVGGIMSLAEDEAASVRSLAVEYRQLCELLKSSFGDAENIWQLPSLVFLLNNEEGIEAMERDGFARWTPSPDFQEPSLPPPPNSIRICRIPEALRSSGPLLPSTVKSESATRILVARNTRMSSLVAQLAGAEMSQELVLDLTTLTPADLRANSTIVIIIHSILCFRTFGQGTKLARNIPGNLLITLEVLDEKWTEMSSILRGVNWKEVATMEPPKARTGGNEANISAEKIASCLEMLSDLAERCQQYSVTDEDIIAIIRHTVATRNGIHERRIIPFCYSKRSIALLRDMMEKTLHTPFAQPVLLAGNTGTGKSYIAQKFCELLLRGGFPFNDKKAQILYTFHPSYDARMIEEVAKDINKDCGADGLFLFPILDEITSSPSQSEIDRLLIQRRAQDSLVSPFVPRKAGSPPVFLPDKCLVPLATCNPNSTEVDFVYPLTPSCQCIALHVKEPDEHELERFLRDQLLRDARGPRFSRHPELVGFATTAFLACKPVYESQAHVMGPVTPRSAVLFSSLIVDLQQLMRKIASSTEDEPDEATRQMHRSITTELELRSILVALFLYFGVRTVPRQSFMECLRSVSSPRPITMPSSQFETVIKEFCDCIVGLYDIATSNVVPTRALRENLVCLTIAILSRKPLLVLGQDGVTSKTTAIGIVTSQMKGKYSSSTCLQSFPAAQNFRLQLSPETTTNDIDVLGEAVKQWNKTPAQQGASSVEPSADTYFPTVVVEELSMMQRTGQHSPARAFHALLDNHQNSHSRDVSLFGSGSNDASIICTSNFDNGNFGRIPVGEALMNRFLVLFHAEPSDDDRIGLCLREGGGMDPDFIDAIRKVALNNDISIRSAIAFVKTAMFVKENDATSSPENALRISRAIHLRPNRSGIAMDGSMFDATDDESVLHWTMRRGAPRRVLLIAYSSLAELEDMWARVRANFVGPVSVVCPRTKGPNAKASQIEALIRVRTGCENGSLVTMVNPACILSNLHALFNDFDMDVSSIQVRNSFDTVHIHQDARMVIFLERSKVQRLHEAVLSRAAYVNPFPWRTTYSRAPGLRTELERLIMKADEPGICPEMSDISVVDWAQMPLSDLIAAGGRSSQHIHVVFLQSGSLVRPEMEPFGPEKTLSDLAAYNRKSRNGTVWLNMTACDDEDVVDRFFELRLILTSLPSRVPTNKLFFCVGPNARLLMGSPRFDEGEWRAIECPESIRQYQEWPKLSQMLADPHGILLASIEHLVESRIDLWAKHHFDQRRNGPDVLNRLQEWVMVLIRKSLSAFLSEPSLQDRLRWALSVLRSSPRHISFRTFLIEHIRRMVTGALNSLLSQLSFPIWSPHTLDLIDDCVQSLAFQWLKRLVATISEPGDPSIGMMSQPVMKAMAAEERFPFLSDILQLYRASSQLRTDPIRNGKPTSDELVSLLIISYLEPSTAGGWTGQHQSSVLQALQQTIEAYVLPKLSNQPLWNVIEFVTRNEAWLRIAAILLDNRKASVLPDPQPTDLGKWVCSQFEAFVDACPRPNQAMTRHGNQFLRSMQKVSGGLHRTTRPAARFFRLWCDLSPEGSPSELVESSYVLLQALFVDAFTQGRTCLKEPDRAMVLQMARMVIPSSKTGFAQFLYDFRLVVIDVPLNRSALYDVLSVLLELEENQESVREALTHIFISKLGGTEESDRWVLESIQHLVTPAAGEFDPRHPQCLLVRGAFLAAASKTGWSSKMARLNFSLQWLFSEGIPSGGTAMRWFLASAFFPLVGKSFQTLRNTDFQGDVNLVARPNGLGELNFELFYRLLDDQGGRQPALRNAFIRSLVGSVTELHFHELKDFAQPGLLGEWFAPYCEPMLTDEEAEGTLRASLPRLLPPGPYFGMSTGCRVLKAVHAGQHHGEDAVWSDVEARLAGPMTFCFLPALVWSAALMRQEYQPGHRSAFCHGARRSLEDTNLRDYFFPGMERSQVEMMREARIATSINVCPCGFVYGIGDCGRPMEQQVCPKCRNPIGGGNHNFVGGNRPLGNNDLPIHGVPLAWYLPGARITERALQPIEYRVICVLVLMSFVAFGADAEVTARANQLRRHWDALKEVTGMSSDSDLQRMLCYALGRMLSGELESVPRDIMLQGITFHVANEIQAPEARKAFEDTFARGWRAGLSAILENQSPTERAPADEIAQQILRQLSKNVQLLAHPLRALRDEAIKNCMTNEAQRERTFGVVFFKSVSAGPAFSLIETQDEIRALMIADAKDSSDAEGRAKPGYDNFPILWRILFLLDEGTVHSSVHFSIANELSLDRSGKLHAAMRPIVYAIRAVNDFLLEGRRSVHDFRNALELVREAVGDDDTNSAVVAWERLRMDNDLECQHESFHGLDNLPAIDFIVSPNPEDDRHTPARVVLQNLVKTQDAELQLVHRNLNDRQIESISVLERGIQTSDGVLIDWIRVRSVFNTWLSSVGPRQAINDEFLQDAEQIMKNYIRGEMLQNLKRLSLKGWEHPPVFQPKLSLIVSLQAIVPQESLPACVVKDMRDILGNREYADLLYRWAQLEASDLLANPLLASAKTLSLPPIQIGQGLDAKARVPFEVKHLDAVQWSCIRALELRVEESLPECLRSPLNDRGELQAQWRSCPRYHIWLVFNMLLSIIPFQTDRTIDSIGDPPMTLLACIENLSLKWTDSELEIFRKRIGSLTLDKLFHVASTSRYLMEEAPDGLDAI